MYITYHFVRQTTSDQPKTLPRPSWHNFVHASGKPPDNISPKLRILIISDSSSTIKLLFLFLDCVFVCMCRRPRCERRRTRWRAVVWTGERGLVSRPRTRRTVLRSGPPRRLWRRQVQSRSLMHAFVLVFINTTYWPILQNCICFACWKHGWIATPWFVITIPWPPRLMSKCVWTLIAARTLRTLNTVQLVS